jgi:hypothetical protein
MKMPKAQERSTYSYAVAPFFGNGVLSPAGIVSFMFIVASLDPVMESKLMPLLSAAIILYVYHSLTKNLVPGKFAQTMSMRMGVGFFNSTTSISALTRATRKLQRLMANGYSLPPAPSVIGKYEL